MFYFEKQMNFLLRLLFALSLVFIISDSFGQSSSYISPEFKVRYQDTTGRYIQLINYFDSSYYTREIYLRKKINEQQAEYYKIEIDTATGIGSLEEELLENMNLQIGKTLEIPNLELKQNKINKVEIRSEQGFLSVGLKSGRSNLKKISGTILNVYDSSIVSNSVPCKQELSKGKYFLKLETIPPIKRTLYIKPSKIVFFQVHRPVPLHIINKKAYDEYVLEFAHYPYKKFRLGKKGSLDEQQQILYLQPKKVYVMKYKKKGRHRYRKKKFYIDTSMELFNITLD